MSLGEKHSGKGTGIHTNEEQLVNTGGVVPGGQGETIITLFIVYVVVITPPLPLPHIIYKYLSLYITC